VPVDDVPGQVNTREKAADIVHTLDGKNAVFLRGHGTITVAANLRDACCSPSIWKKQQKYFIGRG